MTADEVAACTNALGMFGDFRSYDMGELENTLNSISIAAKDGEKSILSLQGVKSILSDLGYNGYEAYSIIEDIKGMGSLELLDFNTDDSDELQTLIDKLSELKMLNIDGRNIDVSGLANSLRDSLGMTVEDIQSFLGSLGSEFNFTDSMGTDVVTAYSKIQEQIKGIQSDIAGGSYSSDGIAQLQAQLEELQRRADALREPVDIKLTSNIEQTSAKLDEATRKYNELKASIESKQQQGITVTYGDTNALNELSSQKAMLEEQLAHYNEMKVTVSMEREQADADIKDLTSDKNMQMTVNIANKGEVDSQISQWMQPKSTTLKVNVTANDPNGLLKGGMAAAGNGNPQSGGGSSANTGKAHSKGTAGNAFASGYNGLPVNEKNALRSEYGQKEMTVYPDGRYEITDSPTLGDLPKGTVIFNEEQTERILKGSSHAAGTVGDAYASGTAGGKNPATKKSYSGNGSSKTGKSGSDSSSNSASRAAKSAMDATAELFDWIERRIKKFQNKFDKWINQAETAISGSLTNKYYKKASSALKSQLSTYGKAYNKYMKQADASGLSKKYRNKVKNGKINIESIKDEKLKEQIKEYQEWYDKAQESTSSFVETAEKLYNLPLDKAEKKVKKFSEAIELLDKKLGNAVGSAAKNALIDKQTKEEGNTLKAYQDAEKESQKSLKSASKNLKKSKNLNSDDGITKKEKKKIKQAVKEGKEVDLSYFKEGSAGYNAAVKYNEALKANTQAAYDLNTAQEEYTSWLSESSVQKFENIQTEFEHVLHSFEQQAAQLNNRISLNEEKGYLASSVFYNHLMGSEQQNLNKLTEERGSLVNSLNEAVSSGNIKEFSDDWYELKEKIDDVTNAIDESTLSLQEYANKKREIEWNRFDYIQDNISNLVEDVNFAVQELSRTDLVSDDIGGLTDNGKSVAALRVSNYETYKEQAADYLKQIQKINGQIANDPYNSKLLEQKRKLAEAYEDCISGAEDEKYAVIDLYKQAYDALLNKIRELISEYEELLDAEKDAYDYQQSIAEKTKEIADIRKQLSVFKNDMSEESRTKIQKLEIDLADAEKSLQEAQYDKYISDTKDMFRDLEDTLSDEINDLITALADNFDRLISNINIYSENALLNAQEYLTQIGVNMRSDITNAGLLIQTAINNGIDVQRGTQTTIAEIKDILQSMQSAADLAASNASAQASQTAQTTQASQDESTWIPVINTPDFKFSATPLKTEHVVEVDDNNLIASAKRKTKAKTLKGFAKGSKHIPYDQMAVTQEEGTEVILSDGSILTPLKQGDMVFTNEMSKRLWEFAQNPANMIYNLPSPAPLTVPCSTASNNVNIEFGDINLPNVKNSEEFVDSVESIIRNAVCKDGKTMRCMTEGISSKIMNKGIGGAKLYR